MIRIRVKCRDKLFKLVRYEGHNPVESYGYYTVQELYDLDTSYDRKNLRGKCDLILNGSIKGFKILSYDKWKDRPQHLVELMVYLAENFNHLKTKTSKT